MNRSRPSFTRRVGPTPPRKRDSSPTTGVCTIEVRSVLRGPSGSANATSLAQGDEWPRRRMVAGLDRIGAVRVLAPRRGGGSLKPSAQGVALVSTMIAGRAPTLVLTL